VAREEHHSPRTYGPITSEEVREALRKIKIEKAVGPDSILVEIWKTLDGEDLDWLTDLFNVIFKTATMPHDWRQSTIISLYKSKGDVQDCNNYRAIKLLSHTMKLWEHVIEDRLRTDIRISKNEFGFISGRSYRSYSSHL